MKYADLILNLVSKTSLGKLDTIQNAAMRLMTWLGGGLRSTLIAALEIATGFELLKLRREAQTLMARERFLRSKIWQNPLVRYCDVGFKKFPCSASPWRRNGNIIYRLDERHWKLRATRTRPTLTRGSPRYWFERQKVGDRPSSPQSCGLRVH